MSPDLRHELLGEGHAFAASLEAPLPGLVRPQQVHGARVAVDAGAEPGEADGIVASRPGALVGIVTADCVPILARAESGAVAAIHAGWRGLAAGVIEAGIAALRSRGSGAVRAVVGPCASSCCYEVDAPVLDALGERYSGELAARCVPTRSGHARLDLGGLAGDALQRAGVVCARIPEGCTICHERFESHRRDGDAAGRMLHWIRVDTEFT